MSATTAVLTEPTSETMAPAFSAGAMASASIGVGADGACRASTRSARRRGLGDRARRRLGRGRAPRARASASASRSQMTMRPAAPVIARPRGRCEEPIRPMPTMRERSRTAVRAGGAAPCVIGRQELSQRRDDAGVGVLLADAEAQAIGQAVGGHAAQRRSRPRSARRRRGAAVAASAKRISRKLPWLGGTSRPSARISRVQPRQPARIMRDRRVEMLGIAQRRDAGRLRRRVDVERAANAVDARRSRKAGRRPSRAARRRGRRPSRRCGTSRRSRARRPVRRRPRNAASSTYSA